MNENQIIAAYVRTSTEDWDDLQQQTNLIMRNLVDEETLNACSFTMYVDYGYPGTTESRPAYEALLNDMSSGKVAELIIVTMDRLSRSSEAYEEIIHLARENGIEIITIL